MRVRVGRVEEPVATSRTHAHLKNSVLSPGHPPLSCAQPTFSSCYHDAEGLPKGQWSRVVTNCCELIKTEQWLQLARFPKGLTVCQSQCLFHVRIRSQLSVTAGM